jgi:hypothetical protein
MGSLEFHRVGHFETPIHEGNGGREKADVVAANLDPDVTQYILVPEGRKDDVHPDMAEYPSISLNRRDPVAYELQTQLDRHGDIHVVRYQLATLAHAAFGAMALPDRGPRVWARAGEDAEYRELLGSVLGMQEMAEPVRPDLAVVETRTKVALYEAVRTLRLLDDTHITILPARPRQHPLWQDSEQAG